MHTNCKDCGIPTVHTARCAPCGRARLRRHSKRAAIVGALLALACHLLPHHWQEYCHAVVQFLVP